MKTYLDCLPCFLNQALRAGRQFTDDKKLLKSILDEIALLLPQIPLSNTPPETGEIIYKKIRELTGIKDPYKKIKVKSTKEALALLPLYRKKIQNSNDKLLTAIKLAIAGNIIDFAVSDQPNIKKEIEETQKKKFAIIHYKKFKNELRKAKQILYIGDNAGESVFDKLLIENLNKPVSYVVREIPVLNDVTYEDAKLAGIDEVANIIKPGTASPGLILKKCNRNFKKIFNRSDMVISKGQGNYEGLSQENRSIFFLLKAKCEVIARDLKVNKNDIIFKSINV